MDRETKPPKFAGEAAQEKPVAALAWEILAIGRRCAALPDLDKRSADEILGCDEQGLPT